MKDGSEVSHGGIEMLISRFSRASLGLSGTLLSLALFPCVVSAYFVVKRRYGLLMRMISTGGVVWVSNVGM